MVNSNYIDFLVALRKKDLEEVTFEFVEDITPQLKYFIYSLCSVEYKDGYGQIKEIICSFIDYWINTISNICKLEEIEFTSKNILDLYKNTIVIVERKNIQFETDFSCIYELNTKYIDYKEILYKFKETIEQLDKTQTVCLFAKQNVAKFINKVYTLLDCTHTAIGLILAANLNKIRLSLEDLHSKARNNLKDLTKKVDSDKSILIHQLYDKNKECMRMMGTKRAEAEDVKNVIAKIRNKLKSEPDEAAAIQTVSKELEFWEKRRDDFLQIYENFNKINIEVKKMEDQIAVYESFRCTEYPGSKLCCWDNIGVTFKENIKYLRQKHLETVKALVTHFSVGGHNRMMYKDNLGVYYKDEFANKIYIQGKSMICDVSFLKHSDPNYLIDANGMYTMDKNGLKIYRVNSSSYKIDADGTFVKTSVGYNNCQRKVSNQNCNQPGHTKETHIKGKLSLEEGDYVWKISGILSMSLLDVDSARPKNPLHYLAQRLLANKYGKSKTDMNEQQKESEDFRDYIYKERREKALAERRLWKSKQIKRRLPEESDDAQDLREVLQCTAQLYSLETE